MTMADGNSCNKLLSKDVKENDKTFMILSGIKSRCR